MKPIKVSDLSFYLERLLQKDGILQNLLVEGEVANLRRARYLYFDLIDDKALVHCIYFEYQKEMDLLKEGDKVVVRGRLSLYHRAGKYQINVQSVSPTGMGSEALRFLLLKEKLTKEGLFDPERKKVIPSFVRSIGLISSASGAVLHDFANEASRRFPLVKVIFAPASVQGDSAPAEIISSLDALEKYSQSQPLDLVVIARGGGSGVDLSCFNDESLVRRVAAFPIPLISAIGHQVDYTLLDLVSDLRASTPTEAAILALPDKDQLLQGLDELQIKIGRKSLQKIKEKRFALMLQERAIEAQHPFRKIDRKRRKLGALTEHIQQSSHQLIYRKRKELEIEWKKISKHFNRSLEEINKKLEKGPLLFDLFSLQGEPIKTDEQLLIGKDYKLKSKNYSYRIKVEDKERNK